MSEFSITYKWRVPELRARQGLRSASDMVDPLRRRGITLSESRIYRILFKEPERVALAVLVALSDVLDAPLSDLITYEVSKTHMRVSGAGTAVSLADVYRPIRA